MIRRAAALALWRLLAVLCVALGLIGVVVPGLPTVPFLLVAAWAGGRGWPQLEAWLLAHPRHGPHIRRWRDHRAVPRRAKWAASGTMLLSTALIAASSAPWWVKLGVPGIMAVVAMILRIDGLEQSVLVISGSGLIIVVGVVIDTMRQLEAQLLMRHYEGFIKS